jgi:hypothetical protein
MTCDDHKTKPNIGSTPDPENEAPPYAYGGWGVRLVELLTLHSVTTTTKTKERWNSTPSDFDPVLISYIVL